jgi:hypothetical protein
MSTYGLVHGLPSAATGKSGFEVEHLLAKLLLGDVLLIDRRSLEEQDRGDAEGDGQQQHVPGQHAAAKPE